MDSELKKKLIRYQRDEITEHRIYMKLAAATRDSDNAAVLEKIGNEELRHAEIWEQYTGTKVKPRIFTVLFYYLISRVFGITFGIKLMERREDSAQDSYGRLVEQIPAAKLIMEDENAHERMLVGLIEEERLQYMGSIVLGLNDALVELTGALAGLTFALQNTRLTAVAGLITGIAASLSMASSEYLSSRAEGRSDTSVKSALYTGLAYIVTVFILVLPYFLFQNYLVCLGLTLLCALLIIFIFNYYLAVARDLDFFKRFMEMALLSFGVAAISFIIGFAIRHFVGVDI